MTHSRTRPYFAREARLADVYIWTQVNNIPSKSLTDCKLESRGSLRLVLIRGKTDLKRSGETFATKAKEETTGKLQKGSRPKRDNMKRPKSISRLRHIREQS